MSRKVALMVCFLGASSAFAQTPVVQSVLHAANYSPLIAPGVWVAIFGSNLATTTTTNTALPIPLQLGGVTVTMNGEAMPLRYVSPSQINALVPFDIKPFGYYNVIVTTPSGTSSPFETFLSNAAPAVYTQDASGVGPALVFDANFSPVTKVSTAPLILYASGLGPTNPAGTTAGGNATEPLNRITYTPFVRIGGVSAQVLFAGLAPGLPGIYQLNVVPSSTTAPVDNSLAVGFSISLLGTPTSAGLTTLPVPEGANTANLTGSLNPTFPLSSTVLAYSPLVTAAKFNVALDVRPSAQPFNLVAACPGGSMTVAFNPGAGTWQATANVPTAAMRTGDFSSLTSTAILDFLTGLPFAGNFIPQSRLDPTAAKAMSVIPFPNYTGSIANVNFLLQGAIPANGHFAIDDSNNANLANFGSFFYASKSGIGGQLWRTNSCSLTVDGVLVSSSFVTFK